MPADQYATLRPYEHLAYRDFLKMKATSMIRIAAIGDLLLTTRPGAPSAGRGLEALSGRIRKLFASCDLVLANLECTLPGGRLVPTEPRVFTSDTQLQGLAESGVRCVSLANNHGFDAGDEGFANLTGRLDELGISHFGAGLTLDDARRPLLMEIRGIRLALIGAVDASTGMRQFAGDGSSGVPGLEHERLRAEIERLREEVDHVILSPHWGEERFRFPSPQQVEQARSFINAGASMVMGHHPHVIQGMEMYRGRPIQYSLGNFFVNHVYWQSGDYLTWNRFERTGCILLADLAKDGVTNIRQIPVYDDGTIIDIDTSGRGEGFLKKANRMLTRGISHGGYRREALRVRYLLPVLAKLGRRHR
jgi:poly-gamma-glutamate synthesis protein (capsule biosynthesis protein)